MDELQQRHHVEDVGRILLQTQDQLRLMREQMAAAAPSTPSMRFNNNATQPDVIAFQEILERTELEIRAKAELVLNGLVSASSHAASVLPAVTSAGSGGGGSPKPRPRQNIASLMAARRMSSFDTSEADMEYFRAVRAYGVERERTLTVI